ncbi:MAG: T9SS type A sorting domain-containing protein [Bacteroidetes bacterium]|nr:T9SS type A sorting domain-containing protein [Bacteroidota bacterium]
MPPSINKFKIIYSVTFDATNYPSGVYYYKIKTGSFVQVRKMILVRSKFLCLH